MQRCGAIRESNSMISFDLLLLLLLIKKSFLRRLPCTKAEPYSTSKNVLGLSMHSMSSKLRKPQLPRLWIRTLPRSSKELQMNSLKKREKHTFKGNASTSNTTFYIRCQKVPWMMVNAYRSLLPSVPWNQAQRCIYYPDHLRWCPPKSLSLLMVGVKGAPKELKKSLLWQVIIDCAATMWGIAQAPQELTKK
jgi:hypothetical protein